MNSVGFLADSNKLKISEPSMSFSPEDCLVWMNKEMESQAQRQVHTHAHTHSQLVRQNCRQERGRRDEGIYYIDFGNGKERELKQQIEVTMSSFGKAERVIGIRVVLV